MDLDLISSVLKPAITSLALDAPLHPWWLGEARPRRPVHLRQALAAPCPPPCLLAPELVIASFLPEDRLHIAHQVEAAYQTLLTLTDEPPAPADAASVVIVQLGVPLIGRDRVLLRVCTSNLYGDDRTVTGDFHAWLDPAGSRQATLSPAQEDLATKHRWTRWDAGLSPGLRAP